jgi:hypothetical protein
MCCKKNKRGKKGKSHALFAPFVLLAASGLHQRTDSFVKVFRQQSGNFNFPFVI